MDKTAFRVGEFGVIELVLDGLVAHGGLHVLEFREDRL